jgi:uncharacterized protein
MTAPGPPSIISVPTSVACFIGKTAKGPVLDPKFCQSFRDYQNTFGSDNAMDDMSITVSLFFLNGGTTCWFTRIANENGPLHTSDYNAAFDAIDNTVDLFNLMILIKDNDANATPINSFYNIASAYCQKKLALLIMDPPTAWITDKDVLDSETGINNLRSGLVKEQCAVYFPNLIVTANDGSQIIVGPSGAVAGIMSRIDSARGVWKAPAGGDADLRGITGLTFQINDVEAGPLNSSGINAIRTFQNGSVCWGERTIAGDDSFQSEWKYIPVRRTALYIEASLKNGLQWTAFEPNDETLWSKIRLSTGNFMHQLFLDGALQGNKANDAFFIKCDKEIITQQDINSGIVNLSVGFAPLKPAEFIIIDIRLFAHKPPS